MYKKFETHKDNELTPYQRFIERLVHAIIIVTLAGIVLKVLVF